MSHQVELTESRIRAVRPATGNEVLLWDKVAGFGVRCYASGRKVYFLQFRTGRGREAGQRRMPIGLFGSISLADARKAARMRLGEIAAGRDPQAERKEAVRKKDAQLDHAIDAYEEHLGRRHVVNKAVIVSTLRREILGPLSKLDLSEVDRQAVAKQVARLERAGKPGAAQDLRAKATTFLNWAVNRGLVKANPLAGWRRERATRAETTGRTGRVLSDAEIKDVWTACEGASEPFGDYVRVLLLLGQRRGETAAMRWNDVDLDKGTWRIPPAVAKNGREHVVPLPPLAVEIIGRQAKWEGCPFVFAGRDQKAMAGWTQRMRGLAQAASANNATIATFTLHDCRRTFRSGLTRLGVESELAELMLNHARADLIERYDREPRRAERAAAAQRWADHIAGLIGAAPDRGNVVELSTATR